MELAHQLWKSVNPAQKILLLHGMGGTGALWRPVAIALETDFDVLAPDQRGHGRSQVPVSAAGTRNILQYRPVDFGQDLVDTLEALQFHPTWVVGHSMGVRSACAFAHLRPDWVKGLVLVDLGLSGPAGGGLGEDLATFLKQLPLGFDSRAQAREFLAAHCPDPSIAQYLLAVSIADSKGKLTFPFDHGALIETIHATRDSSVRTWLEELSREKNMPVLILRGASSLVFSREDFEREKAHFKNYESIQFIEVQGAGHGLPFEKRIEFAKVLREFCTE